MAKMKVYELAQEIGVKSAEILALLKNKGIEVKSHMSVLEDRQVEDVRSTLKAPAKSEEASKTTEKTTASGETKAPSKTGEGTPVKKKKSIIFVSNPHNSKMPGGAQIPRKAAHSEKKAAPQGKTPNAEVKKPAADPKAEAVVEKPIQKPVVAESAKAEAVKAEQPKKEAATHTQPIANTEAPVKTQESAVKSEAPLKAQEAAAKNEAPAIKAEESKPAQKNDVRDNT
ncbi:MAG: translation initiation factor IF-2 N-terminal domain-containing protein, partial [Lachnospiraceae bacterium]|nr:translation initiation factor IF-2 N-terminal domain-containing protein [Lachnospiraceae bacterium]